MLDDKTRQAIRDGAYRLLLGAGFSASSHSADGRKLPLGKALVEELSEDFDLPSGHSLARLTGTIDDPVLLDAFFQNRFRNCKPSAGLIPLTQFTWNKIYTFNIDDILAELYKTEGCYQRLQLTTFNTMYHHSADPEELPVIHLHGSVLRPLDNYVFSYQDYGEVAARDSTWFKILVDEMATYPFVIIGASLEEPDLEYYLQKRKGAPLMEGQMAPSIYVDPFWDKVKEKLCHRFGLLPFKGSAEDFLRAIVSEVGVAPRPADLIMRYMSARVTSSSRSHRIFYRQWLWVRPDELPESTEEQPELLRGIEPTWHHIQDQQDITRNEVSDLVTTISSWFSEPKEDIRIEIVTSTPGQGKSCILMRVALELAKVSIPVYYYSTHERLDQKATREALANTSKIILIIDNVVDHGHQVADLLHAFRSAGTQCFLLAAERIARVRQFQGAAYEFPLVERRLRNLTSSEARDLSSRLRMQGLLGLNAGKPDDEISRLLTQDLVTALVTVSSSHEQINGFLDSELADLSDEARDIYLMVALAHSRGYPLKTSVLNRATGMTSGRMRELFRSELSGLVRGEPPHGEFRVTRHRVLASKLFDRIGIDDRLRYFENLLTALAPYVNRETVIAGTAEARLAGSLMDYDKSVKRSLGPDRQTMSRFYRSVRAAWRWNSRYWEQLALMSAEVNLADALRYAEQAVGIERHRVPLTTLSKIQFIVARSHVPTPIALQYLRDALSSAHQAIDFGRSRRSPDLYPYDVALRGILEFAEAYPGGWDVPTDIRSAAQRLFRDSEQMFRRKEWEGLRERWTRFMPEKT